MWCTLSFRHQNIAMLSFIQYVRMIKAVLYEVDLLVVKRDNSGEGSWHDSVACETKVEVQPFLCSETDTGQTMCYISVIANINRWESNVTAKRTVEPFILASIKFGKCYLYGIWYPFNLVIFYIVFCETWYKICEILKCHYFLNNKDN